MRNRISQPVSQPFPTADASRVSPLPVSRLSLDQRPTLQLGESKSFTVDMERFFDFSFSFAEALVDLEDRFANPANAATNSQLVSRENAIQSIGDSLPSDHDFDCDFEIDARWM